MHQTSLVLAAGNPVMSVQVNHDKNFAFIEVICCCCCCCWCCCCCVVVVYLYYLIQFRSVEECSNALAFDGLNLQVGIGDALIWKFHTFEYSYILTGTSSENKTTK